MNAKYKARFWAKVKIAGEDDCWLWIGSKHVSGTKNHLKPYGMVWAGERKSWDKAHRVSWELAHGEKPTLDVLHKCDNPLCVNPKHLFLGTQADNNDDCRKKWRHKHGEEHWKARINAEIVREIRQMRQAGMTQQAIADKFGIPQTSVSCIVRRRQWAHVA